MPSRKPHFGFFAPQERWTDNSAFYEEILRRKEGGILEEVARTNLALYARFPPSEPHDRLVAHAISVYDISDVRWVPHGKQLVVPAGPLEHKVTVDLGKVLVHMVGKEAFVEEEMARNVLHPLPDGTFIRGTTYRRIPREETLSQLQAYVALDLHDNGSYSFALRTDAVGIERPPEFEVTKYIRIDGETIEEDLKRVQAAFQRTKGGELSPGKFKRWVTMAGSSYPCPAL